MEQEEGDRKVKEWDDLDLVSAPKPPPVELMLGPDSPQNDRAPRPLKETFVEVEPPEPKPGFLKAPVEGPRDGQKKKKIGKVYAHGVDVEKPVDKAVLKPRLVHVLEEEIEEAWIAQKKGRPQIIKS